MKSIRSNHFSIALVAMAITCSTVIAGTLPSSLPKLSAGQSLGLVLEIPTISNLRDVGGYKTQDGAVVVEGLAYRSDTFNPMNAEDIKKLERLDLKYDYDLRTNSEVKEKPDQIPSNVQYLLLNVLADAKSAAPAELEALLHHPKKANAALGGGKVEKMFTEAYRQFISLQSAKQSYRTLFLSLSDEGKLPAVFHCTTGKDRTGWASAALLTLLGVPEKTVMEDFMRSNEYILPQYKHVIDSFVAAGGEKDIVLSIFGVKKEYLEASFDEMEKQYGTIDKYFADGLGIDEDQQEVLKNLFRTKKE